MSMPSSYDVPITDSVYVPLILSRDLSKRINCIFQDIQMSQQGANYHMLFANMIIYLPFS